MKTFNRQCPNCQKKLNYCNESNCNKAKKCDSLCSSCACKKRIQTYGIDESFIANHTKGCFIGNKNPFYGKAHTKEAKKKMSENTDKSFMQTDAYKEKVSKQTKGKGNPMYGKTVYNIWVEKYGKEQADEKNKNWKEKQRINSTGKNNPMYGKSSPQGSGNGWSGWYHDFYFRSLKELSYLVQLDEDKVMWQSAEHIKIKYINWDGNERTYRPDFLVENQIIVEIKPMRLWNSPIVKLKTLAAISYCQTHDLIYKLVDQKPIDNDCIKKLRNTCEIKFIDRYEKLFQQKYL